MDPTTDTMSDRIENYVRDMLLDLSDWAAIKVMFAGEPTIVPVNLHPFATIFVTQIGEAKGEDGQTDDTGFRRWRYDGYISVEDLIPDVRSMKPVGRKADIPSYKSVKRFIQAGFRALVSWAGSEGELNMAPITSYDGQEITVELRLDVVHNAIQSRPDDSVTNVATLSFHIFTRRQQEN